MTTQLPDDIRQKVREEATRRSTHTVSGPTPWEQKDLKKKADLVSFAEFLYSLLGEYPRWVKASERLGEFEDSDIPDWKFFHPGFCKIDSKPAERGYFRKDTTKNKIVFSYFILPGSDISEEISEKEFHRVEWLYEPPAPAGEQEQSTPVSTPVSQSEIIHMGIEFAKNESFKLSGADYQSGVGFGFACGYEQCLKDHPASSIPTNQEGVEEMAANLFPIKYSKEEGDTKNCDCNACQLARREGFKAGYSARENNPADSKGDAVGRYPPIKYSCEEGCNWPDCTAEGCIVRKVEGRSIPSDEFDRIFLLGYLNQERWKTESVVDGIASGGMMAKVEAARKWYKDFKSHQNK